MKKLLYLGLRPPKAEPGWEIVHYPVIKIAPRSDLADALTLLPHFTHIIFTSQTTIEVLKQQSLVHKLIHLPALVVGPATATAASAAGWKEIHTAQECTAEGLVAELPQLITASDYIFWPHARQSRPVLTHYLEGRGIPCHHCIAYETELQQPVPYPHLTEFDAIQFTSPTTVDGFFSLYDTLPAHLEVRCIGPITSAHLKRYLQDD